MQARQDVSEAEDLLRRALKIQPEDPNASRNLVKALLQQQDFASAEAEAMRMADTADKSGIARYQLGIALEGQGNLTGAMQAYRESLEQDPLADPALVNLVSLMVRSGDAEGAEKYLAEHVDRYPDHLQARLLLAEVLGAQGRQEEAVAIYRDAIEREPAVAAAYIGLAGLFPEQSNERLAAIAQGAAEIPDSSQLGLALGSTYEKRGEYEQAIAAYAAALQARDSDFIANNLAALLLDFRTDPESFQQALALAQRFERRENVYPLNLAVLGWAYYRNGDYTLASRYLERAVAQAPQLSQLRYYLGMTYARNGNPVGARQELQLAVDGAANSGQTFTGLDEAQRELEQLTP